MTAIPSQKPDEARQPMRRKTVYLNGVPVGWASTWYDVAALLTERLRRPIGPRDAQKMGSEGPDGFYVRAEGRTTWP
jgi:hypothetical protein